MKAVIAVVAISAAVLAGCARHAGPDSGSPVNIPTVSSTPPTAAASVGATSATSATSATPSNPVTSAPDLGGIESDLAGATSADSQADGDISAGDAATSANDTP